MKNIVYMTLGLPASGKSSWAHETYKTNPSMYKMVSKDELRLMLDNGNWNNTNEKFVEKIRDSIILNALGEGKDVIVHDCNFGKHVEHVKTLVAGKADVKIVDFTNVPLDECIDRDRKRGVKSVGEKVIRRMYNQFLRKEPVKPEFIDGAPNMVICDLDGTIALMGDRNPYDASTCEQDEINQPVDDILSSIRYAPIFVSGRSDKYRQQTINWLVKHGYGGYKLFMRKEGDNRDDRIVKQEIYDAEIKGKFNVMFVLDDRSKVVSMWRDNGLTCLQVAEGDF